VSYVFHSFGFEVFDHPIQSVSLSFIFKQQRNLSLLVLDYGFQCPQVILGFPNIGISHFEFIEVRVYSFLHLVPNLIHLYEFVNFILSPLHLLDFFI